jgi:Flp pilus assembly protein TadD
MNDPRRAGLQRAAIFVTAVAVVMLSGCQRLGPLAPKWSWPWAAPQMPAPRGPLSAEMPPVPPISKRQQLEGKFALARTVEQAGELDNAIAAYTGILKTDPKFAAAHHRLAVVFDKQGRFEDADEHYRQALHSEPRNAELLADYGYCLYMRGQMPEAEDALRKAIAASPELARAHNNLGLLLARTGRVDEALDQFGAARCTPSEARANVALGLMLEERWPAACEHLTTALSIDPNSKVVRRRLNEVQSILARTAVHAPAIGAPAAAPPMPAMAYAPPGPPGTAVPTVQPAAYVAPPAMPAPMMPAPMMPGPQMAGLAPPPPLAPPGTIGGYSTR